MGVQADQALAGLEALLDGPATPSDPDKDRQRHRAGHKAAVEGQLPGALVAADQQPALGGLASRTEAIVVEQCTMRSSCSNFKIGTETSGPVRNVTVRNCTISGRPGVRVGAGWRTSWTGTMKRS